MAVKEKESNISLKDRLKVFFDQFGHSIQTKITLPYILLSLIVAVGGALLITQLLMRSVDKRFQNSLIETAKISADLLVQEEGMILETVRLVSMTQGMDQYIIEQDAEAIREIVLPLAFNSGEDRIEILDGQGIAQLSLVEDDRGRYPVYDSSRGSDFFVQIPFVQKLLSQQEDEFGDKFAEVVLLDDQVYLYIGGPIRNPAGETVGVVLVGRNLEDLIADIRRETLAQVTIYDLDGEIITSTLSRQIPLTEEETADVIGHQADASVLRKIELIDIGYQEILYAFEVREKVDLGIMGMALSTDFIKEANQGIRVQVFVLVTILLFMTILTGILIARMITRPLNKLKNAALEVSDGNLDVSIDPIGEDEIALLTKTFNQMVSNLKESNRQIVDAYDKTLEGWSKALELRDRETEGHTLRVTKMTLDLARILGYDGDALENIRRGALIHDIGKFSVPDRVLLKPDILTDEEYDIMKLHPQHAYEMLSEIPFLRGAIDIPYCHHERWDGSGYPRGLMGEEIPVAARIFSVVDVWDAVTRDRPYREAMARQEALDLITQGSGEMFDPEIVQIFLDYLENGHTEQDEE